MREFRNAVIHPKRIWDNWQFDQQYFDDHCGSRGTNTYSYTFNIRNPLEANAAPEPPLPRIPQNIGRQPFYHCPMRNTIALVYAVLWSIDCRTVMDNATLFFWRCIFWLYYQHQECLDRWQMSQLPSVWSEVIDYVQNQCQTIQNENGSLWRTFTETFGMFTVKLIFPMNLIYDFQNQFQNKFHR